LKKACCCPICKVTGLLVVVGALNWGLIGLLNKNLVSRFLGAGTKAERIVYILIGIAGIVKLVSCFICCPAAKKCDSSAPEAKDDCCGTKH